MNNKTMNTLKYLLLSSILSSTAAVIAADNEHSSMPLYSKHFKHQHVTKAKPVSERRNACSMKITDIDLIIENNDQQIKNNSLLQSYIKKILECPSITEKELEHYIALINKIPGYEAQHTLRNLKSTNSCSGKSAELVLDVKRTKARLVLDANNNGSSTIGKYQFSALGQVMNPFGWNDSIILNAATSNKPKSLFVVTGGYLKRLNTIGTSANVLVSYLKDNPLIGNPTNNTTLMYRGELEQYVVINNKSNIKLDLGIEHQDVKQQNPAGSGVLQQYSDNMMYVGGRIQHVDSTNAENFLTADYHYTLDQVKFKIQNNPTQKFDGDFGYFKLNAHRDQPLFSKFSIFAQIMWQYSDYALPIEHQFIVGGHIGRGYTAGLISANKGLDGTLELRYTHDMTNNKFLDVIQPYGFIEGIGLSSTNLPINKTKLYSAGGGIRAYTPWDISLDLEVAAPLTKNILVSDVPISNPVKFTFFVSKTFKM